MIDESYALNRAIIEAVISFLTELNCNIRVLLVGDVQQIPPIVNGEHSAETTIDASLASSAEYHSATKLVLHSQFRHQDHPYSVFVTSVGNGTVPCLTDHPLTDLSISFSAIALPLIRNVFVENDSCPQSSTSNIETSCDQAISWLYGHTPDGQLDTGNGFKAIIVTSNASRRYWNQKVRQLRKLLRAKNHHTTVKSHTYHALHLTNLIGCDESTFGEESLIDDAELINEADPHVPLAELELEVGDICLLALTIDRTSGLVKNQRVVIVELRHNAVRVRRDFEDGTCSFHTITRFPMQFDMHKHRGLKIIRTQLPLIHAYAMTVNKSQGQTLDGVLLDLRAAFFDHGHAYVALSRVRSRTSIGVFVNDQASSLTIFHLAKCPIVLCLTCICPNHILL